MLHKSFKPAKCKTSLKLAASRIKLLKNKKEVQIKQLRREVAQLLESGHVQTARIRVEHVVREEKTIGAYELIEIYCELIAQRLPIIESQKNCPIDLKEAIASVVFTSPRCADIPELTDVRKHFLAKYGKDFINAAVELRPDCGVNRSLVEKLSAKTPDGPTKLKILTVIAEEHNIKWDPSSFGGNNGPNQDDLLKGPSTFEKASRMHEEPPNFHTSASVDVGSQKAANEEILRNFHLRTSFGLQSVSQFPERISSPVNSHLETQSSRNIGEGSEARRGRYLGDASVNYVGRPDWNMEFADATTAAQAAAESAERASMAARAAAELSSRGMVSAHHAHDPLEIRDARLKIPPRLYPPEEDLYRTQVNDASVRSKSRTPNEHIDSREENPARDHNQYKSNPEVGSTFHGRPASGVVTTGTTVGRGASDTYSNQDDDSDDGRSLSGMTKKMQRVAYQKSSNSNGPDFGTAGGNVVYTETNLRSTELDNDGISGQRSARKNSFEEVNIISSASKIHARKDSGESFVEYTLDLQENHPQSQTLHSSSFMEKQGLSSLDYRKKEDGLVENPFADDDEERISMGDKTTGEVAVVFDDYGSDEDVESAFNVDKGPKSSHTISLLHVGAHQSEDSGIPCPSRVTVDSFKMSFAEAVPEARAAPETEENLPVTFDDSDGLSSENEVEPEKPSAPRESEHASGVQKYSGSSEFAPAGEAEVVSDSGSRSAIGNLTGGRRNKCHVPSPYSQSISGIDSLLNRRRDDHKESDEDPDINYGGDQLEGRPIRTTQTIAVSHEVTVPQPKTGSCPVVYADDAEEFELDADYWKKPSRRPVKNDSAEKKRSSSRNDVAEGRPSRISSGKSRVGAPAGLSRRTKAGTSRDADAGENLANRSSRANTSDYSESHGRLKWRSEAKDDPVVEPAKASGEEDAAGTSRPARPSLDSASGEDSSMQASHVQPKMPQDYETLLADLQSLRANRQ